MNIVTSIHAYNFHLFISYLGKGIRIFPFNDFRKSFYKTNAIYPREISHNKSLQEIITTKHILLGINNSDISSFELNQNIYSKIDKSIINQFKANQLSLDYNYNDLYILTEEQGIVNLDFKNPYKSKILDKIIPKSFEELGEPIVSNMISIDKSILLSIRGFGVSKIEKTSKEETYRSEDAQDVLFYKKEQIIIVADGIEGLVIFKCRKKKPEIKLPLPNYDIPQEIRHFYNHVLIKGKNGLYLLNLNTNKFRVIMEGGVGAFTQYYNYIFYSSNSQIHLLVSSEKGLSEFTLYDEKELDIKRNKYLR